ncbi:uncharacterized protein DUF45 [Streptomyces sp. CG 926]|uniref:YgjP-like metallopeptidase domain-containing protein n=1 Tax=Streptomyces sp. CG 926 TaxID=1882405 RepID=UPI000D6D65D4|nr:YgjP-like metallopeptidase domain-containing protein [Streptomyces sp. CG 926]PWK70122.1 uncharacterized protein DUF45 [Streptomyces sp. CG 926]
MLDLVLFVNGIPLVVVECLRNGEIHRYLGRDQRLLVVDDGVPDGDGEAMPVRLVTGRLRMDRSTAADPERARAALADRYVHAGRRRMRGRLQPWAARMGVPEPAVRVRDQRHRWGSPDVPEPAPHRPRRT